MQYKQVFKLGSQLRLNAQPFLACNVSQVGHQLLVTH